MVICWFDPDHIFKDGVRRPSGRPAATAISVSAQKSSPLTSCRPFSVSWKTPVFWAVSRWDLRALLPIRTLVHTEDR